MRERIVEVNGRWSEGHTRVSTDLARAPRHHSQTESSGDLYLGHGPLKAAPVSQTGGYDLLRWLTGCSGSYATLLQTPATAGIFISRCDLYASALGRSIIHAFPTRSPSKRFSRRA